MKQYTYNDLAVEFARLGYSWPKFHIIGVRSKANEKNNFDDTIYVINGKFFSSYSCTTNPGTYWLLNLMNPKGTAVLAPGQYQDTFAFGLHQGKYEALVQIKPVTVFRDNDKDDTAEEQGVKESGMFGIHIHRANPSIISKLIDKWSAGCQVLNDPKQFDALMAACKKSKNKSFTYTLLEEF